FQKVEMYETTDFGKLMIIDGCTMVSSRENFFYHEMISHPDLLAHPNPKNVVIIGGGDCGTLCEVLKHPSVESVTQID
ncbi:spermidine synthase, partial [Klebsiella pneumoniae]|nr:spermidine synthase [Klebsiella pneumoniae]